MDWWQEWSFRYEFWILVACVLGCVQMMTDEFFFGGSCIGAAGTGILMWSLGSDFAQGAISWTVPYVVCGAGGLIGATLMRLACHRQQNSPDINDEPYEDERL